MSLFPTAYYLVSLVKEVKTNVRIEGVAVCIFPWDPLVRS